MTVVVVCAGGPKQELCSFDMFKGQDVLFIGADKGALYLIEEGIQPVEIVGDFDSLSSIEFQKLSHVVPSIDVFQPEKDETDTELALLKAIQYKPTKIYVTGVTGGRLDHYEAVIRSVYRFQMLNPNIQIKIINSHNEISILSAGKHTIVRDEKYRYISFFAYTHRVENVTLRGVKYETTNETIEIGTSRFTSNELQQELGYISFSSGICLMIRSGD